MAGFVSIQIIYYSYHLGNRSSMRHAQLYIITLSLFGIFYSQCFICNWDLLIPFIEWNAIARNWNLKKWKSWKSLSEDLLKRIKLFCWTKRLRFSSEPIVLLCMHYVCSIQLCVNLLVWGITIFCWTWVSRFSINYGVLL